MSNNGKLVYAGSLITIMGLGFVVISTMTAIVSKVMVIAGIGCVSCGIYRSLKSIKIAQASEVS